jgi:hypothetical protein
MIDDEQVRQQLSKGERHRLRLVALLAAPMLLAIAVLYARAFTVSVGDRFDFEIIRANALVMGGVLVLFAVVIALRFVFFVRMPFKLLWAASLVTALFVALLVLVTTVNGTARDPATIALEPLRRLVDDVGGSFSTSELPAVDPTTWTENISDDRPPESGVDGPASTEVDGNARAKPSSALGREAGAYEWAWSDTDGNLHVTSEPPPEGAKVLSKVRRK